MKRHSDLPAPIRAAAALAAMLAVSAALAACSARRGEPFKEALDVSDPRVARGETVYMSKCNKCHPGGDAGLGPALNNKPMPGFVIHYQTRNGAGAMPAFDEEEIPDGDLADLTSYLKALRMNGSNKVSSKRPRDEGAAERVTAGGEEDAPDVR